MVLKEASKAPIVVDAPCKIKHFNGNNPVIVVHKKAG